MLNVLAELLAQIFGMGGACIDLLGGAVKGERNRLGSFDLTVGGVFDLASDQADDSQAGIASEDAWL